MASPLAAPQPLSPYAAGWPIADHAAGNRHKNGGVRGSGALELVVALKHAHTFGMVHTDDLCNKSGNKNSFVVDACSVLLIHLRTSMQLPTLGPALA
eukprot:scaffold114059_cov22-Tisochrysis_lutea.AAC.1